MAKPSRDRRPRLLALEFWGLGDLALAMPFLRTAANHADVTLVAHPHAGPLLVRFAPTVRLVPLVAPWTAFQGKYRLLRWPWGRLGAALAGLRRDSFDLAVSGRPDPRDHLWLRLTGAAERIGFPWGSSGIFLTRPLPAPPRPHRAAHWQAVADALGWPVAAPASSPSRPGRHVVIHPAAGRPVRVWPRERFAQLAEHLVARGWRVTVLDQQLPDIGALLDTLATADRFIGNDSGPGHLAALLGVPTFTIFGPQLPALFAPQHPHAAWIEGAPCRFKPCFDSCRFATPHCIQNLTATSVITAVDAWLT